MPEMYGVDVSHWNKDVNWMQLRKDGYNFVMLKLGGEEGKPGILRVDPMFDQHYHEAKKHGFYIGCYFFMSHKKEVIDKGPQYIIPAIIEYVSQYEFDMPIAIDVEGNFETDPTDYVAKWCEIMQDKFKFYVMIYGSDISTFKYILNISKLEKYDKWVAQYSHQPEYVKNWGIHQYSNSPIDQNKAVKNYPELIRKNNLNNLTEIKNGYLIETIEKIEMLLNILKEELIQ